VILAAALRLFLRAQLHLARRPALILRRAPHPALKAAFYRQPRAQSSQHQVAVAQLQPRPKHWQPRKQSDHTPTKVATAKQPMLVL
jgi:hypothetical protein